MPLFIIETTAESPIREFWQVEAESAQQARDKFEAGQVGAFLWDEVMGDETEREVAQVHPRADLAGTISLHNAQQEAPAMLAALRETLRDLDAVTGIDDHGSDTIGCIENRIRDILSRIDGAPTAQPAGAIGEAGAGVRDLLFDVRDFLAGFEDCEDNGELVRGLQERIARATEGRADRPKSEPVADFAAHAAAIEAAQGYVSHPAQWNAPTPAQVAHLLALSGIAHGPVSASDGGDCDGGDD